VAVISMGYAMSAKDEAAGKEKKAVVAYFNIMSQ
jgi:hypothetical protein